MEPTAYTILFIDDHSSNYLPSLEPVGKASGFELYATDNVLDGLSFLYEYTDTVNAVILDLSFPKGEMQGLEALRKIKKSYPNLPVIVLTDSDSATDIEIVVECMRNGANNYVGKRTLNPVYLFQVVQNAVESYQLIRQARHRIINEQVEKSIFTIRKDCDYFYFKRCAVFGFELLSVNKPGDEKEFLILKNNALEWHYNLLKSIRTIYNNEIQLNLKFISSSGVVKCYILITVYAAEDIALEIYLYNIQHDIIPFFKQNPGNKNQPYLFSEITEESILKTSNEYPSDYKYTLFYRKPVNLSTEKSMGFGSFDKKETSDEENNPDELFPFTQELSYDKEVFRAFLNQSDYSEIDVQLLPKHLMKQEIDFVKQVAKNITTLETRTVNYETLRLYSEYLRQFVFNTKDKFLISVLLKRKSPNWELHLKTGIQNYFFGLNAEVGYEVRKPDSIYRFSTSKEGTQNQLPFFYDLPGAVQAFRLPIPDLEDLPGFEERPNVFNLLPVNLPDLGLLMGEKKKVNGTPKIKISRESIARHLYIMGQTGTGKSTLIKKMISDCLTNNEGFTLIDPHGDLYDEILKVIPKSKRSKLFLLNPTDIKSSIKSNLIDFDHEHPEQKSLLINELFKIFEQKYDMKTSGGPMFELFFRHAMFAVMDDKVSEWNGNATLKDFNDFFWDEVFHNKILQSCSNKEVSDFFSKAKRMTGEQSWANWAPYITSKINRLLLDAFVSPFVASKTERFNFRELMDKRNILLVKLEKGQMGSENVGLFGQLLLNQISLSAMSRSDTALENRKQHFLFIDEFQNFIQGDASNALSELRKYGVSMILANQTLGQLEEDDVEAILGNVGSLIFFRPGINDYERIKHYLEPEFKREDVLKLPNFNCIARLLIDNVPSDPFVFQTINI